MKVLVSFDLAQWASHRKIGCQGFNQDALGSNKLIRLYDEFEFINTYKNYPPFIK